MSKRTFSILLIDECEADYEATRRELYLNSQDDQFDFGIEWRNSLARGIQAVSQNTYDIILLDINLSDADGDEAFKRINAIVPDIPIIVLTGTDSESLAMKLAKAGAQDYIVKGKYPGILFRSLIFAIERQETLRQLERSERQTRSSALVKSVFFANMSHEIRNPLTAIIGYSEILMRGFLKRPQREKALSAIFSNGKHLLKLISDILDLSKIEAGELKIEASEEALSPFLRDLNQTFTQAAEKKNIEFSIHFEPPIPMRLQTDFFRLRQILYNILGNAVKFTNEGFVKLLIRGNEDDETVIFEVKDSGVGISDKAKTTLFKTFSQGDSARAKEFGGTGLGLVISRELIGRLGGTIDFKSRQGIGSVFTVTLPLGNIGKNTLSQTIPNLEELTRPNQEVSNLKVGGRVLVADDLDDNRDLLSFLLAKVGLEVDTAKDGAVALQLATEKQFDLILLDMQMPIMSGQDVAKALRTNGCTAPIVAITGMMYQESLEECLTAGCDACLPKPFSQEEFYTCILKFLGQEEQQEVKEHTANPSVKNDELAKVRRNFIRKLSMRLEEIETSLANKDLDKLRAEAHRLIGAGLFGFQELSHFGGTLESLIIQEQVGGLSLVEALVNKVRNEIGKITLTNAEQSADTNDPLSPEKSPESTVIVLDDDEANLKAICRVLNVKGFIVAPALTAEEALTLCDDASVSLFIVALETTRAENFDIIRDVRQKLKRNIPVIAMTSRLPSEVHSKLSELQVPHLLLKPISRDQLLGMIDSLITSTISAGPSSIA